MSAPKRSKDWEEGYDAGYKDGQDDGHAEGYSVGLTDGWGDVHGRVNVNVTSQLVAALKRNHALMHDDRPWSGCHEEPCREAYHQCLMAGYVSTEPGVFG